MSCNPGITLPPTNVPFLSTFARLLSFRVFYLFFVPAVLLLMQVQLHATTRITAASGSWSTPSVWASGILPEAGDTAVVAFGDSVWLDKSTPPLAALIVQGGLSFRADTLFLQSGASAFDTLVTVAGTLDADSGWFGIDGSIRPIVHIEAGARFRTAAAFPVPGSARFDSSASPFFALDAASIFEYYSGSNTLTDVTYLINNIFGHAYRNVTLTGAVASFRSNPLTVMGTLHIGFGASTTTEDKPQQTITLSGDVVNDNTGPSGGAGAGRTGCGMLSLGQETWVFDATPHGNNIKDTIHWYGPSQLGNVVVRPNTVLSVRFIDDTHCDSLDVLTNLTEDAPPCGGHLIGRVFSENGVVLSASHPIDSFYGFGLTVASGTVPYLGLTKIVRTSGHLPPNAEFVNGSSAVLPVLRYYRITSGAGPQTGAPDTMAMRLHCDELNGADPTRLNFWRSPDAAGSTWAYSGIARSDLASEMFVWDTTVLGWPNRTGSFLWMLANGYTDTPLPIALQSFTAERVGTGVALRWQTSSETDCLGYEIDRDLPNDSEAIASYASEDSLRSRSATGASYRYTDAAAPAGFPRYDLYEITNDGFRQWLASRVAEAVDSVLQPSIENAQYGDGLLTIVFNQPPVGSVAVADGIGRIWLQRSISIDNGNTVTLPVSLPAGFYFITYRWVGGEMTKKVFVTE